MRRESQRTRRPRRRFHHTKRERETCKDSFIQHLGYRASYCGDCAQPKVNTYLLFLSSTHILPLSLSLSLSECFPGAKSSFCWCGMDGWVNGDINVSLHPLSKSSFHFGHELWFFYPSSQIKIKSLQKATSQRDLIFRLGFLLDSRFPSWDSCSWAREKLVSTKR